MLLDATQILDDFGSELGSALANFAAAESELLRVALRTNGLDLLLEVSDSGPGLPLSFVEGNGSRLMRALASRRENGIAFLFLPRCAGRETLRSSFPPPPRCAGREITEAHMRARKEKDLDAPKFLKRRSFEEGRALVDAAHIATQRLYCDALGSGGAAAGGHASGTGDARGSRPAASCAACRRCRRPSGSTRRSR